MDIVCESAISEKKIFAIFRNLFYIKNRNMILENQLEKYFPIDYDNEELVKSIYDFVIETKPIKANPYTKSNDTRTEENYFLTILNKYFDSKNNRNEMWSFLNEYTPRIEPKDSDKRDKELYIAFHKEFGYN